jgi:hypothetical protein
METVSNYTSLTSVREVMRLLEARLLSMRGIVVVGLINQP